MQVFHTHLLNKYKQVKVKSLFKIIFWGCPLQKFSSHYAPVPMTSPRDGHIPLPHIEVSAIGLDFEQPYPKRMFAGTISTGNRYRYNS
jgi:hypothetical protein